MAGCQPSGANPITRAGQYVVPAGISHQDIPRDQREITCGAIRE